MSSENQPLVLSDQIVTAVFNRVAQSHWFTQERIRRLAVDQPYLYDRLIDLQEQRGFSLALERGVAIAMAILDQQSSFDETKPPLILPFILGYAEENMAQVFGEDTPRKWRKRNLKLPESGFVDCMSFFTNSSRALAALAESTMMNIKSPAERRNYFQGLYMGLAPFWYMENPGIQSFLYQCVWLDLSAMGIPAPVTARGTFMRGYPSPRIN